MTLLEKNIAANIAGSIWQALMGLIFIPFYIKFLGIESWGLIGFFATLLVMFGLLDMGLSITLNRELARLSVLPGKEQEMNNLVRTLEVLYWGIAIFVGVTVVALSPFLAHHWIKAGQLSSETIELTLLIMGFVIALQMPVGFYSGGLLGLQKQVLLNVINVGMSTLRGAGAALVLWLVSPTIQAFFIWQIVVSVIQIFLLALFLWRRLPRCNKYAVFENQLFKGIWRFAAGMSGISILAVILTQLDKVILSKMLSLETFGYYTLACVVTGGLSIITTSITNAIFPRFSALAILCDDNALKQLYHTSTQLMVILVLPVAMTAVFFSYEILLVWTGSSIIAQNTSPLLSIIIIGTALNVLMYLPYTLQLAYGWVEIGLKICLFFIVLLVPTVIILTKYYGALGAAFAWVALNTMYMAIGVPLTHRRLLKGEAKKWFLVIVHTFISVLATVLVGRFLFSSFISPLSVFLPVLVVFLCALFSAGISSQYVRSIIKFKLFGGGLPC